MDLSPFSDVFFVDNERTVRLSRWRIAGGARRNLVTLIARMLFHHRWRRIAHFLDGYEKAWEAMGRGGDNPVRSRSARARLLLEARRRWVEIDRQMEKKERRPRFLPRRPAG